MKYAIVIIVLGTAMVLLAFVIELMAGRQLSKVAPWFMYGGTAVVAIGIVVALVCGVAP